MKILLAEPYRPLARVLRLGLAEAGFDVTVADELAPVAHLSGATRFDVIILDPPSPDELVMLQEWRRAGITTPVLVLSVPGSVTERFDTLGLGPGSALTKPFVFEELLAKLRLLGGPAHGQGCPGREDVSLYS